MSDDYTSELEQRYVALECTELFTEWRAKYKKADRDRMAEAGQAMSDGSYPIADEEDLKKAVKAVGRGDASHDSIRKHVMLRAAALKLTSLIPDNWNADGSLKETNSVWSTLEERATYEDLRSQLQSAIADSLPSDLLGDGPYVWIQDFCDTWAVFNYKGDLIQVAYTCDADGNITLGESTKVRQITSYVPVEANAAHDEVEKRTRLAAALGGNGRGKVVERRTADTGTIEARADLTDATNPLYILSGYASITDRAYPVGSFNETIKRGAFKKTLGDGAQVVFLANHTGLPIASTANDTLKLSEDSVGLRFDAHLDPEDEDAMRVYRKVQTGLLRECSFAFQAIKQDWRNDYQDRDISELSINKGDVSVVNFGANDGTNLAARGALEDFERDAISYVAEIMRNENRAGATISAATANKIQSVLDLVGSASGDLEQARTELTAIRGDEPTDDDEAEAARKIQAANANSQTPGSQGKSDGTADTMPSGSSPRSTAEWLEYRADPEDNAVLVALVKVLEDIKVAKAAQLADPDNATDVLDGEVWSHLEDACAAAMNALVDQAKDMAGETQQNAAVFDMTEYRTRAARLRQRAAQQRQAVK